MIAFPGGAVAQAVHVAADAGGEEVLAALGLATAGGTVVVNGTTADLDPDLAERLAVVLGRDGLAGAAGRERLTVVTGGTDAGIFSILGRAMAGRPQLVGVAPADLVTWPGRASGANEGRVPLEPHHSHFVLVDGDEWGDETEVLLALARALGAQAPSVAVICGGGPVTRNEVAGHARDGRPVVVLAGSGRYADELAATGAGRLSFTVCPVAGGPGALVAAVLTALSRTGRG